MLPKTAMYIKIRVMAGINMEETAAGHQLPLLNRRPRLRLRIDRPKQNQLEHLLRKIQVPPRREAAEMPEPVIGEAAVAETQGAAGAVTVGASVGGGGGTLTMSGRW